MGGLAFAHQVPPLQTPRMPPPIYRCIRDGVIDNLLKHFTDCKSQIEVSGKADYGDVDILVHGPLSKNFDPSKTGREVLAEHIKRHLHAHAFIINKGETPSFHFAIPWPISRTTRGHYEYPATERGDVADKFCQVDLRICRDFDSFRYTYFHTAHGDLWGILGREIRHVGLTLNDKGMYIKNLSIAQNKKNKIFLTDDPTTILMFLGLDDTKYFKEFPTKQAMFTYATECRMFWIHPNKVEENHDSPDADDTITDPIISDTKSNKNDKKRWQTRPILREFMEEFLPPLKAAGKYSSPKVTAEQIRDEAFTQFDIKDEWEKQEKEWRLLDSTDQVRLKIKEQISETMIPDPAKRTATIRSMVSIILNATPFQGSVVEASKVLEQEGTYDLEKISEFIETNWEAVRDEKGKKKVPGVLKEQG